MTPHICYYPLWRQQLGLVTYTCYYSKLLPTMTSLTACLPCPLKQVGIAESQELRVVTLNSEFGFCIYFSLLGNPSLYISINSQTEAISCVKKTPKRQKLSLIFLLSWSNSPVGTLPLAEVTPPRCRIPWYRTLVQDLGTGHWI